ncbi:hypothetical protein SGGMMB4_02607 [Sodalis glossinidius str. 'morsitans']|uniref:Uncharacterized protein n=1 Tax=Sodalis glossinidius (strain morsitans) TaxID=343509 RepID=A0A193QJI0_SODGM|nr:hypothetical protein SGGMMB4_02607 [Sodalis glossinidius str. 'morsitans']
MQDLRRNGSIREDDINTLTDNSFCTFFFYHLEKRVLLAVSKVSSVDEIL